MRNTFFVYILVSMVFIGTVIFRVAYGQENQPPSVSTLVVALTSLGTSTASINLIESTTKTIYIHGTAADPNGCLEIDDVSSPSSWQVTFYRTTVTNGANCTPNGRDCYQVTEQNSHLSGCSGSGDSDLAFEMTVPIKYYADATDPGAMPDFSATNWTARVLVTDDGSLTGSASATTEINTLSALSVAGSVAYGALALDQESAEQTFLITNTGNDNDLDPFISDTSGWTCALGGYPASAVRWNTLSGQSYASSTAVSASSTNLNNLSIPKSSDTAVATSAIFLRLKTPPTGAYGSCTGTLNFTAQ